MIHTSIIDIWTGKYIFCVGLVPVHDDIIVQMVKEIARSNIQNALERTPAL